ncbi:Lactoylglutathione lyase [Fusarium falciforme]|uniref:Lactoylglutathione lyase n=1 Tax=Fusarium falciforme TaxID=195108 RepID=UPI002301C257|nr:Lactoylglutathione lyase [Fusarium falciforme]WAO91428.1 Lactoylglutathione lyase [Fusarium falciforme]
MPSQTTLPDLPHGQFLPNGLNDDPPLSQNDPTIGYRLNHTMLRIRDPRKSLHFYINLMGMRTVFAMNIGPVNAWYLGYPKTSEHQADLKKFGEETVQNLRQFEGLLELGHIKGSENQPEGYYQNGNDPPNLGFGHLGFTVPDVPAALKRLKDNGVEVVKDLGEATTRASISITKWENEHGIGVEEEGTDTEIHSTFKEMYKNVAYVKDPDGYLIELIPQNMGI